MKFYTQWDRPEGLEVEHVPEESITEMAYVPPQVMIRDMMQAGQRLAAERRARFDSLELGVADPKGDIPLDPTREKDFDLADVSRSTAAIRVRQQARKEALEAKKKEAEAAAQRPPDMAEERVIKAELREPKA